MPFRSFCSFKIFLWELSASHCELQTVEMMLKTFHCHILSLQVDLLKHGIPDPSSLTPSPSQSSTTSGPEKDSKDIHGSGEYMAAPIFVHTK